MPLLEVAQTTLAEGTSQTTSSCLLLISSCRVSLQAMVSSFRNFRFVTCTRRWEWTFFNLWPSTLTLTFALDLDMIKTNHCVKYPDQSIFFESCCSHTHTHPTEDSTWTAEWLVKCRLRHWTLAVHFKNKTFKPNTDISSGVFRFNFSWRSVRLGLVLQKWCENSCHL